MAWRGSAEARPAVHSLARGSAGTLLEARLGCSRCSLFCRPTAADGAGSPSARWPTARRRPARVGWLADADTEGDALNARNARDWAVRDYRSHLQTLLKRKPRDRQQRARRRRRPLHPPRSDGRSAKAASARVRGRGSPPSRFPSGSSSAPGDPSPVAYLATRRAVRRLVGVPLRNVAPSAKYGAAPRQRVWRCRWR
jgi:hypothetical protein